MNLKNIHNIYFLGIGGIGMSAIARYFASNGKKVAGYDKTPSPITKELEELGVAIHFEDAVKNIPISFLNKEETLVVYTPAIPKNQTEFNYFLDHKFTILKRAAVLGKITETTFCLAVAGTHGKTTTSSILGHIMAEVKATSFLGGIAENYNSNLILGSTEISVVEADEFDRSFLQLSPNIACVTSMDADHLDIYGDASALEASFLAFADLVHDKNKLLHKKGLPLQGQSVALEEPAAYQGKNIRIENGAYKFDFIAPEVTLRDVSFCLPGHHNLHNAVTALSMAILAGAPTHLLKEALSKFKGVERRFSYRIRTDDLVLIDDYAHHPTELDALHQGVSEMYPDDQKVIVFQPHLFSRTRDFIDGFAESLAKFDQVMLLDIYPARETPIEGVTSSWLLEKIKKIAIDVDNISLVSKQSLSEHLKKSSCRIKLLVGAGDIGAEVSQITKILEHEN